VSGAGESAAVEEQCRGGDREGAVGGEAAEHPGPDQQPEGPSSASVGAAVSESFQEHTEQERAGDVDPEDRPAHPVVCGERGADRVAERGADRAAERDEAEVAPPQCTGRMVRAGPPTCTSGSVGS